MERDFRRTKREPQIGLESVESVLRSRMQLGNWGGSSAPSAPWKSKYAQGRSEARRRESSVRVLSLLSALATIVSHGRECGAPGDYPPYGNQDTVGQMMVAVDLTADIPHPSPMALFEDADIHPFDLSTPAGRVKCLVTDAVT